MLYLSCRVSLMLLRTSFETDPLSEQFFILVGSCYSWTGVWSISIIFSNPSDYGRPFGYRLNLLILRFDTLLIAMVDEVRLTVIVWLILNMILGYHFLLLVLVFVTSIALPFNFCYFLCWLFMVYWIICCYFVSKKICYMVFLNLSNSIFCLFL